MNSTFKAAPYSVTAWIWTFIFIAGMFFFAARVLLTGTREGLFDTGAALVLLVAVIYGFFRSVRAYSVTDDAVAVLRRGPGRISIDRANIASVEARSDLGAFFNTSPLSIGGLFGWAGNARVRRPTDINSLQARVYGTNAAYSVVMQMRDNSTLIVTPADPAAFVAALRKAGAQTSTPRSTKRKGSR